MMVYSTCRFSLRPLFLAVAWMLVLASSAAASWAQTPEPVFWPTHDKAALRVPFSIQDDLGRTVSFQKPAVRIASLAPSFTETLFAVGCGKNVLLRDRWAETPPEAKALPATDAFQLSPEHVAGFRPDVVILHLPDDRHVRAFEVLGIPLLVLNPQTYEEATVSVEKLALLCGRPDDGNRVAYRMRQTRKNIATKAASLEKTRVYIELDYSDPLRPYTAGKGSFIDELIHLAGGENIAGGLDKAWVPISAEAVIRADPAVLILLNQTNSVTNWNAEFTARRPAWKEMNAVKTGRIVTDLDANLLSRPGPALVQGLSHLFDILHPEQAHP